MKKLNMTRKPGRLKSLTITALTVLVLPCMFCSPALALSETDVQAQVEAVGKESVSGNVLVWFLCAIAFLKISQKIDSFMASLGINVGHTGSFMMAELMVAARGLGTAWYRQYAADAVEKSPYMAADVSIAYKESIVKKLPPAPRRKDRV